MRPIDADKIPWQQMHPCHDSLYATKADIDRLPTVKLPLPRNAAFDGMPTADIEPVVHAHWEAENRMRIKIRDEETDFIERKCSNCHLWSDREILTYYPQPAKRCSLCGAKMDEGEKGHE